MSAILAIESSTSAGSLVLHGADGEMVRRDFPVGRLQQSGIFRPLAEILEGAPDVRLVVAGTGPGSYTGVRTGIAVALGVSLARGVPLIGIPSVCAFEEAADDGSYAVTGDARRGSWWYAEVSGGRLSGAPVVDTAGVIAACLARGSARVFTMDPVSPEFCAAVPAHPSAEVLAARAAAMTAEEIDRLAQAVTEPLYLRAPYITQPSPRPGGPAVAGTDQRLNAVRP